MTSDGAQASKQPMVATHPLRAWGPSQGQAREALDTGTTGRMALQSLDAQAALLPYALVLFGVALPVFAWVCSFASNRLWMMASLLIFAIIWAAFYALIDASQKNPDLVYQVGPRSRIHIIGGLLWGVAISQIALMGLTAGPAREVLELLAVGGAAASIFFCSPYLPTLLIIAPMAGAAPILALYAAPASREIGHLALGVLALVAALSLIFNRLLRRQFMLTIDREALMVERAQSLSRAEALAQSKSDLIATLSHEIRNGLTGVADVLAAATTGNGRNGPSREQMAAALTSARDLIEALNATLDTESAEANRLTLERRAFDAAQILCDVAASHRSAAAAKGLELSVHVEEVLNEREGGAAIGDPPRTRQILSNLIANAIKYTVRGRIEVRVERLGENHLRFEIADTGPGLTPDEIDVAFQPFKRIPRTGAGVSGAGLGLSLSRRLAQLMDGAISVESALSVGSCFRFDLPFDPMARAEIASPGPAELSSKSRDSGVRALRVLMADDNALGMAMLRAVLEQLGHQVLQVADGKRAYELAQICDVDLMIMSARMPTLDGPDLVRGIRALDRPIAKAPIITLIDGDAEEARACLKAGANQILRRPVTVSSVARAIATALRDDNPPQRIATAN